MEKNYLEYNGKEYEVNIGAYPPAPLAMYVSLKEKEENDSKQIITVCLGNYQSEDSFVQHGCSFIDINNNPCIVNLLEQTGFAKPYIKWGQVIEMQSGFVSYPVYEFNKNMLKELDPQGFEEYTKKWGIKCTEEQDKMSREIFSYLDVPFEEIEISEDGEEITGTIYLNGEGFPFTYYIDAEEIDIDNYGMPLPEDFYDDYTRYEIMDAINEFISENGLDDIGYDYDER